MTNEELKQAIICAVDPLGEGEVAYKPEGVAIAVLGLLEQKEQWRKFDPEDSKTWPQKECECWIMLKDDEEPTREAWDPDNCGPELGWTSYRPEFITHWQPISVPVPPGEKK